MQYEYAFNPFDEVDLIDSYGNIDTSGENKGATIVEKKYNVGSLFAGIGGICLGFKQSRTEKSGFNLTWANEIDEYACETYRYNFDHMLIEGDINKVLFPQETSSNDPKGIEYYNIMHSKILENRIDILTGGFPCQAFSIAGDRKGFDDERGVLFMSFINLVRQLEPIHGKPRVLFLENVKNLKNHDGGRTYQVIRSEIEKLGYIVKEHVLNTMDYSHLPQNRERIYICCFLSKQDADKFVMFDHLNRFKIKHNSENRAQEIQKIIDYSDEVSERYYYNKKKYPGYFLTEEEYNSIPIEERNEYRVNLDEQVNELYQFYQVRRGMYVRKNKSDVCPTLTANMGTGGHNVPLLRNGRGVRKLTPAEALRLQGFPVGDGFKLPEKFKGRPYADSYLYKQAGNAVSVPIIRLIASELLKVLESNDN